MATKLKVVNEERRGAPRWKVFEFAGLSGDRLSAAGVIDDLSSTGASVTSEGNFKVGDQLSFDIEGFKSIPATVARVDGSYVGLAFILSDTLRAEYEAWLREIDKEDR